jgi:hypothetical protein
MVYGHLKTNSHVLRKKYLVYLLCFYECGDRDSHNLNEYSYIMFINAIETNDFNKKYDDSTKLFGFLN